jgi:hypothetical protein
MTFSGIFPIAGQPEVRNKFFEDLYRSAKGFRAVEHFVVQQNNFELVGILARTAACGNAPEQKKNSCRFFSRAEDIFRHSIICFARGATGSACASVAYMCAGFELWNLKIAPQETSSTMLVSR